MCQAPYPMGFSIVLQICTYFINFANFVLIDETFDLLMFKKLVFKVCFYLVGSFHRTVAYLICY